MALPGFTAERSIYATRGSYNVGSHARPSGPTGVVPQDTCGQCTCDANQCCKSNSAGCWCALCTPHLVEPGRGGSAELLRA